MDDRHFGYNEKLTQTSIALITGINRLTIESKGQNERALSGRCPALESFHLRQPWPASQQARKMVLFLMSANMIVGVYR
jgi:hypothetical protein